MNSQYLAWPDRMGSCEPDGLPAVADVDDDTVTIPDEEDIHYKDPYLQLNLMSDGTTYTLSGNQLAIKVKMNRWYKDFDLEIFVGGEKTPLLSDSTNAEVRMVRVHIPPYSGEQARKVLVLYRLRNSGGWTMRELYEIIPSWKLDCQLHLFTQATFQVTGQPRYLIPYRKNFCPLRFELILDEHPVEHITYVERDPVTRTENDLIETIVVAPQEPVPPGYHCFTLLASVQHEVASVITAFTVYPYEIPRSDRMSHCVTWNCQVTTQQDAT